MKQLPSTSNQVSKDSIKEAADLKWLNLIHLRNLTMKQDVQLLVVKGSNTGSTTQNKPVPAPGSLIEVPANTWANMIKDLTK
mgnify:CR=1 FL=1